MKHVIALKRLLVRSLRVGVNFIGIVLGLGFVLSLSQKKCCPLKQ